MAATAGGHRKKYRAVHLHTNRVAEEVRVGETFPEPGVVLSALLG